MLSICVGVGNFDRRLDPGPLQQVSDSFNIIMAHPFHDAFHVVGIFSFGDEQTEEFCRSLAVCVTKNVRTCPCLMTLSQADAAHVLPFVLPAAFQFHTSARFQMFNKLCFRWNRVSIHFRGGAPCRRSTNTDKPRVHNRLFPCFTSPQISAPFSDTFQRIEEITQDTFHFNMFFCLLDKLLEFVLEKTKRDSVVVVRFAGCQFV